MVLMLLLVEPGPWVLHGETTRQIIAEKSQSSE